MNAPIIHAMPRFSSLPAVALAKADCAGVGSSHVSIWLGALGAHEHEAGDQDRNDADASSNHHDELLEIAAFEGFRCAV